MEQKPIARKLQTLTVVTAVLFGLWWLYITLFLRHVDHNSNVNNQAFAALYGVIAVIGGVAGVMASRIWGAHKSLMGRALLFFAIGLFAQEFGQIAYSFYSYVLHVQIPYPSVGDIGYFSSVFFYIYAALQLLKAAGAHLTVKYGLRKFVAVLLPLILLAGSYAYFLRDYHFDFSSLKATVTVILDFGYPLGQAAYIAIGLLTYLLSRNFLGGIMKRKILFIVVALIAQYASDFSYLAAAKANKAYPGGANDFLYLIAYTVMTLALISFQVSLINSHREHKAE